MSYLTRLLLVSIFSLCCFANTPQRGKVQYLIELLQIKNQYEKRALVSKESLAKTFSVTSASQVFFNKVHEKIFPWSGLEERFVSYFQTQFDEQELNKLIAIYELEVMKKLKGQFKLSSSQIMNDFFTSKEKLREFNQLYNRNQGLD